jgi:hypothetical protein
MIAVRVPVALLMVLLVLGSIAAQTSGRFRARLATVPIDFVTAPAVTGSGAATAELTGTRLKITGTFEGMTGPATLAQVHRGPRGIRGPVLFDLTVSKETKGSIEGTVDLKPNQIEDLKQGRFYIQIHSEKAPDGNLWGWLFVEP